MPVAPKAAAILLRSGPPLTRLPRHTGHEGARCCGPRISQLHRSTIHESTWQHLRLLTRGGQEPAGFTLGPNELARYTRLVNSPESPTDLTQRVAAVVDREPLAAVLRVIPHRDGAPQATLQVSGHSKNSLKLGPGIYRVGAAPDADLVLTDPAVSRLHFEARLAPEGVLIRDLDSRNGTFYRGQRIGELTLSLGSTITVGETELEVIADREDFEGTQGASLDHYGQLYGASAPMKRLFTLMRRLEGSLVNVLIEGESGTGKELIARALHENSEVRSGPFVALNCGALDRALVRSELFGHKKGAFTGALGESVGAFADADGGTLFLDEIGELPQEIQPVLLRALESGATTRVGETKARPVKVRVIAATHRHLKEDVGEGVFRADLYYRLMVVKLTAPPLRHRMEDIPLLAVRIAESLKLPPLEPSMLAQLQKRAFPGNVRELKHALLAYSAVGELPEGEEQGDDQLNSALRLFVDPTRPYAEQKEALIDKMTVIYLKELIAQSEGNRSEAARVAELQRGYLRRLLEKYGLE